MPLNQNPSCSQPAHISVPRGGENKRAKKKGGSRRDLEQKVSKVIILVPCYVTDQLHRLVLCAKPPSLQQTRYFQIRSFYISKKKNQYIFLKIEVVY